MPSLALAWLLLLLLLLAPATGKPYPSLVECVCNTTLASQAVVSTGAAGGAQAQKYAIPSCVDDVFARTGIRWHVDGPLLGGVTYWRKPSATPYTAGRAAQRLMALGYRCERIQLYDATDTSVY